MNTFPQPVHMTPRQEKFRLEYKNQISPLYNGLVHIGIIYVSWNTSYFLLLSAPRQSNIGLAHNYSCCNFR